MPAESSQHSLQARKFSIPSSSDPQIHTDIISRFIVFRSANSPQCHLQNLQTLRLMSLERPPRVRPRFRSALTFLLPSVWGSCCLFSSRTRTARFTSPLRGSRAQIAAIRSPSMLLSVQTNATLGTTSLDFVASGISGVSTMAQRTTRRSTGAAMLKYGLGMTALET